MTVQYAEAIMNPVTLLRAEYGRSERALYWSLLMIAIVNALMVALLYAPGGIAWVLLSLGLAFQLLGFAFRLASERHSRLGQRFRHIALLNDAGLNAGSSISDALLLADSDDVTSPAADAEPYYSSSESIPERRLVDDVAESAFFSTQVAERAARHLFMTSFLFGVLIVYALIVAVFSANTTSRVELAAQIALLAFAFVGAGDFVALAYRYRDVQLPARELLAECERVLAGNVGLPQAYTVLAAYEVIMANSPPLPSAIYRRQRQRLNQAWKNRVERLNGTASADVAGRA